MAKTLEVTRAGKVLTARRLWSKDGITPSYGIGFWCMSTRWKGNLKGYPIDLLLETCSVQDQGDILRKRGGQLQW